MMHHNMPWEYIWMMVAGILKFQDNTVSGLCHLQEFIFIMPRKSRSIIILFLTMVMASWILKVRFYLFMTVTCRMFLSEMYQ